MCNDQNATLSGVFGIISTIKWLFSGKGDVLVTSPFCRMFNTNEDTDKRNQS